MADNANGNGNSRFKTTVDSLVNGMESFLSTKTVVGDPVHIGDTIILPLVDVQFGMGAGVFTKDKTSAGGGLGAKISPSAVLVITNGCTRLVNVKSSDWVSKLIDMAPDMVDKFKNFARKTDNRDRSEAMKAMEETIIEASKVEEDE